MEFYRRSLHEQADRRTGETEVIGDCLVVISVERSSHHLAFALAQQVQAGALGSIVDREDVSATVVLEVLDESPT